MALDAAIAKQISALSDESSRDSVTDDDLAALGQQLGESFQSLYGEDGPSNDTTLGELQEIVDANKVVSAEADRRAAAMAAIKQQAQQLLAEMGPGGAPTDEDPDAAPADPNAPAPQMTTSPAPVLSVDSPAPVGPPAEGVPATENAPAPPSEPAAPAAPEPQPASPPADPAAPEEQPVTAASTPLSPLAATRPATITRPRAVAPTVLTAAAGIPHFAAGQEISPAAVAQMLGRKLDTLVAGASGVQYVAHSRADYPSDRFLSTRDSAVVNMAKVREALRPENMVPDPIVASGGICAPVEARYDLLNVSEDSRPVRDGLVKFGADRGGVRYILPPKLAALAGAVGVWTEATDATPGGSTKNVLAVSCGSETTAYVDAVTTILQFGNFQERSYPELVQLNMDLAGVQHSRQAEQKILTTIEAASRKTTYAQQLGAARDLKVALLLIGAGYRQQHRMSKDALLRTIMPTWVYDMIVADLSRSLPGDNTWEDTTAAVDRIFADARFSPIWSPDYQVMGDQTGTTSTPAAVVGWPTTVKFPVFAEGSFLFLDGGELDLGVVRDSTLNKTNDYQMFSETFEQTIFAGVEADLVTATVQVNGAVSGSVAPAGIH